MIDGVLGRGGFGIVYRATRQVDGKRVAIKLAQREQPTAIERLESEGAALRAIGTPHVPEVFESSRVADGSTYIVMEFVEAPMLASLMNDASAPRPVWEVHAIARAIMTALAAAHARGLVHRDLKPENIFLLANRDAMLFDFGLVKRVEPAQSEITSEAILGTAEYMAPEQCDARADIDPRADIYSLGIIIYELLSGSPPFWGNQAEVQEAHRSRRPARLEPYGISRAVDDVVMRCLAKEPHRRFQDIEALRQAFDRAIDLAHVDEPTPTPTPAPVRQQAKSGTATPSGNKEKRMVGLLWFESRSELGPIQDIVNVMGGQLAHVSGSQRVVAFGHEAGDNPTRRAMHAAENLIARGHSERVLVDIASLAVQTRPDGTRRYVSPLFLKKDRYPTASDPQGIMISVAGWEVLPELEVIAIPGRPGTLRVVERSDRTGLTTVHTGEVVFVGHDDIVDRLLDFARTANQSTPTVAIVSGEPGHGKSQLANELTIRVQALRPAPQVLALRAPEPIGGGINETLRDLLRRALDLPAERPPDGGKMLLKFRLGDTLVDEHYAGLSLAVAWANPSDPDLRSLSAAPGALRSAMTLATGEVLRVLAGQRPLALVIDDAHFVDDVTLDAISYATLREGGSRLWVCLLARPAFRRANAAFGDKAARCLEIELPPLDAENAGTLARMLLQPADNISDKAIALLVERTQGVPLLLHELISGLKRDGIVRRVQRGTGWMLATDELERLPSLPLVQWLGTREIEALSPQLAAFARFASLLGPNFDEADLEGVVHEFERTGTAVDTDLDAGVGVRRLIEADILVRHRTGRVGFRRDLLRETIYQAIPEPSRLAGHHAAYRYYHARCEAGAAQELVRVAYHAARAGIRDQAVQANLLLAEQARARHVYLDAESLYNTAFENVEQKHDARLITILQGRAAMRFRASRYEDALADYESAGAIARERGDTEREIELLLDAATVLDWCEDFPRSLEFVQHAKELTKEVTSEVIEARLLLGFGRSNARFGDLDGAKASLLEAARRAEALGDAAYETHMISMILLVGVLGIKSELDQSIAYASRLIDICTSHGDKIHLCSALMNRCFAWIINNEFDKIIADGEQIRAISRETGSPALEAQATHNLGELAYLRNDFETAERYSLRCLAVNQQVSGYVGRTLLMKLLLARIKIASDDFDSARKYLQDFVAAQTQARAEGRKDAELTNSDQILCDMVVLITGDDSDAAWEDLLARSEAHSVQQERIEVVEFRGLAALRRGQPDVARCAFEQAHQLTEEIPNVMGARIRERLNSLDRAKAVS